MTTPETKSVTQRSKQAIHWRKPWLMPGARKESWEVACGHPIGMEEIKDRTTHDTARVTCAECLKMLQQ